MSDVTGATPSAIGPIIKQPPHEQSGGSGKVTDQSSPFISFIHSPTATESLPEGAKAIEKEVPASLPDPAKEEIKEESPVDSSPKQEVSASPQSPEKEEKKDGSPKQEVPASPQNPATPDDPQSLKKEVEDLKAELKKVKDAKVEEYRAVGESLLAELERKERVGREDLQQMRTFFQFSLVKGSKDSSDLIKELEKDPVVITLEKEKVKYLEDELKSLREDNAKMKAERDHVQAQLEDLRVTGKFKETIEQYEKRLSDFASERNDIAARIVSLEALIRDRSTTEPVKKPVNGTLPPAPPAPQSKTAPVPTPTPAVTPQTAEAKTTQVTTAQTTTAQTTTAQTTAQPTTTEVKVAEVTTAPVTSKEVVAKPAAVPVPAKKTGSADIVGFGKKSVLILRNGVRREIINASPNFTLQDGWDTTKHIRTLGDTTGDGHPDLIGFKDDGVYVSRNRGDNTFDAPTLAHTDMGYNANWRVDKDSRFAVDLRNKGYVDFIGFGDEGVYVTKNNGDGTYPAQTSCILHEFGGNQGWKLDSHIRLLVDLRNNNILDIVGFGEDNVSVSLGNGDGTFGERKIVFNNLSVKDNWEVKKHPRLLGDVTGNGLPDIVGFGEEGVYVALNKGNGTFDSPKFVLKAFGYGPAVGAWRIDRHYRYLADMNGDGRLDIVGFGNEGVWVAFSNGDGTFLQPKLLIDTFGYDAGDWRVGKHPRFVVDLTGDGFADIVAFGEQGVYVSFNDGKGRLGPYEMLTSEFAFRNGEWDPSQTVRYVTNVF